MSSSGRVESSMVLKMSEVGSSILKVGWQRVASVPIGICPGVKSCLVASTGRYAGKAVMIWQHSDWFGELFARRMLWLCCLRLTAYPTLGRQSGSLSAGGSQHPNGVTCQLGARGALGAIVQYITDSTSAGPGRCLPLPLRQVLRFPVQSTYRRYLFYEVVCSDGHAMGPWTTD